MTEVRYEPEAAPGVALVTFAGEDKLNAFSRETWAAFGEAVTRFGQAADADVLVLTGAGRAFVAGADIAEYVDASPEAFVAFQRIVRDVTDSVVACEKPVVAAVNGYALGGGFELVLACDLVVASSTARFGVPEAKIGLLPGGGGTQRLPRAVGPRVAKELLMTGRLVDADEAFRLGLANRVVDPNDLLDAAFELAQDIRAVAPLAVRMAKRLVDQGLELGLSKGLDLENREQPKLFATRDGKEGIAAFQEKREPRFTGE